MDFATKRRMVPLQHKCLLTMQEAAQYSGIDMNELQAILSDPECDFVLQAGRSRLIKRDKFEAYLDESRLEEPESQVEAVT